MTGSFPPMRREQFRMTDADARAFLRAAPYVHIAGCADGAPVLKTVNVVELDGAWYFHAAPAGEKMKLLGTRVVLGAEELVADVPSTFTDQERACVASALYRSVQVHGVLERVDDAAQKARALQAMMERFQPHGGHRPITHHDPMYTGEVRGVLVCRVVPVRIDGKAKLAQNKKPHELRALLEQLWRRGAPSDPRAIDLVCAANPGVELPPFLRGPSGVRLRCAMDASHAHAVAALLAQAGVDTGATATDLAQALCAAPAWVGAVDDAGAPVGSAHSHLDRGTGTALHHVIVREDWRGRGVGAALLRLLADHPSVRVTEGTSSSAANPVARR